MPYGLAREAVVDRKFMGSLPSYIPNMERWEATLPTRAMNEKEALKLDSSTSEYVPHPLSNRPGTLIGDRGPILPENGLRPNTALELEKEMKKIPSIREHGVSSSENAGSSYLRYSQTINLSRKQPEIINPTGQQTNWTEPPAGHAICKKRLTPAERGGLLTRDEIDRPFTAFDYRIATPPASEAQSQGTTGTGTNSEVTSTSEFKARWEKRQNLLLASRTHLAQEEMNTLRSCYGLPVIAHPGADDVRDGGSRSTGINSDVTSRSDFKAQEILLRAKSESLAQEEMNTLRSCYGLPPVIATPGADDVRDGGSRSTGINSDVTSRSDFKAQDILLRSKSESLTQEDTNMLLSCYALPPVIAAPGADDVRDAGRRSIGINSDVTSRSDFKAQEILPRANREPSAQGEMNTLRSCYALPPVTTAPGADDVRDRGPTNPGINSEVTRKLELEAGWAWQKQKTLPQLSRDSLDPCGGSRSMGIRLDPQSHTPPPDASREVVKIYEKSRRAEMARREVMATFSPPAQSTVKATPPASKVHESRDRTTSGLKPEATSFTPSTANPDVTESGIPVKRDINVFASSALPHRQNLINRPSSGAQTKFELLERHDKYTTSSLLPESIPVATCDRVAADEGINLAPTAHSATPADIWGRLATGEKKSPAPATAAKEEEEENKDWIILSKAEVSESQTLSAQFGAEKTRVNGGWIFM